MLDPETNKLAKRPRTGMLVAASVAALALIGGLLVIANRDGEPTPADRPEPTPTVPNTVGAEGETAPAPDAVEQDPTTDSTEPGAIELPIAADESPQNVGITVEALHGYWLNTVGASSLFVDFRPDGTFTISDTGRLGRGAFTNGTFEATDGTTITFRTADDASECQSVTMTWTGVVDDRGVMTVDALAPDCDVPEGTEWEWTRVSPASAAGLQLQAGDLDVEPEAATENLDIEGLWLRVGTGDVLAIDSAGTYLLTSDGSTLEPLDSGAYVIESPGVLTFTSDGSGQCDTGEAWTWRGATSTKDLMRENQARGFSMRADSTELCESADAGDSWRLLSPEKV